MNTVGDMDERLANIRTAKARGSFCSPTKDWAIICSFFVLQTRFAHAQPMWHWPAPSSFSPSLKANHRSMSCAGKATARQVLISQCRWAIYPACSAPRIRPRRSRSRWRLIASPNGGDVSPLWGRLPIWESRGGAEQLLMNDPSSLLEVNSRCTRKSQSPCWRRSLVVGPALCSYFSGYLGRARQASSATGSAATRTISVQ